MEKRRLGVVVLIGVLLICIAVFIFFLILNQTNYSIESKIKVKLINYEIQYTGIGGNVLYYKVTSADIKDISKSSLNEEEVWKVKIGDSLSWNIYFDIKGDKIIKTEQLFVT